MPDETNHSRQSPLEDKPARDFGQPPTGNERSENSGLTPDMRGSLEDADALDRRIDTGSLLRRITGSLYHVTGPLKNPQSEESPNLEQPVFPHRENPEDGILDDLRASLSDTPEAGIQNVAETPAGPPDDVRRMTDALDITRLVSGGRAEPETQQTVASQVSSEPVIVKNEARIGPDAESPTLIRRITGSLRRMTGTLGTSRLRAQQRRENAPEAVHPEKDEGTGEKSKRDTGPLGSLLTGILRSSEGEKSPAKRDDPEPPDYVSEIRQDLTLEEIQQSRRPEPGGNIFQRITSGLRRATGSLGRTSNLDSPMTGNLSSGREQLKETPVVNTPAPMQDEIEGLFLADRLADAAPPEQHAWAEPEDIVIELPSPASEAPYPLDEEKMSDSSTEAVALPYSDSHPGDIEPLVEMDQAELELENSEEETDLTKSEPDWMIEIRKEAADREAADRAALDEEGRASTSPLKKFLTGIFQPEETRTQTPLPDLTDNMLTGRLGKDLERETQANEPAIDNGMDEAPSPAGVFPFPETKYPSDDELTFLERLQESGFGQAEEAPADAPLAADPPEEDLAQFVPYEPLEPPDTRAVFTISPEDEKLLWGNTTEEPAKDDRTIRAIDWDPLQASLEETGPQPLLDTSSLNEAYAATFLTGSDRLPPFEIPGARIATSDKENLQHLTEKLGHEHAQKPFEDIRAVLLDDYRAAERQGPGSLAVESGHSLRAHSLRQASEQIFGVPVPPKKPGLRDWLQTRTVLQKIILVEIILVIVALLVVVPLFIIRYFGNPSVSPSVSQTTNLPYPVSVTLPGGWRFNLQKSTLTDGKWRPQQGEWLEGSELRRVIALPWNRQTEAVVQTFQQGDLVRLTLNNQDTIDYQFDRIDRVGVDDTTIFSDRSPSLVIILYEEDSTDRWVIICTR